MPSALFTGLYAELGIESNASFDEGEFLLQTWMFIEHCANLITQFAERIIREL